MASKAKPFSSGVNKSPSTKLTRSATLFAIAFLDATAKALGLISSATIFTWGRDLAKAIAMQPDPVPRSRIVFQFSFFAMRRATSTKHSVSGLGIKTS